MDDTTPKMAQKMREMLQKKSPLERMMMGCSMHQTSRYLITRAILENNPNISSSSLRQEIFLKFYGNDFSPIQKKKILHYLDTHT